MSVLPPRLLKRLDEPEYIDHHLKAQAIIRQFSEPYWYDAQFLLIHEVARRFIALVRPDRLRKFEQGFETLKTPRDFQVCEISDLFDRTTRLLIKKTVEQLSEDQLEQHEVDSFGRFVVHDHPFFTELQDNLVARVSSLAGCELEVGYNFLSFYGQKGRCELHLDHPLSMFTLDYCIDQNVEWPIHLSKTVDWPSLELLGEWDPARILEDTNLAFQSYTIKPNDAVLFSGSGQWHYRDSIPPNGSSTLLFFHFFPLGAADLVYFGSWPSRFDIPELEALCDIFAERYPQLEAKAQTSN